MSLDEWDVVVLGTGAAGLTAAFTAAQSGARVGLYEKWDKVGGTTAWSGGHGPKVEPDARVIDLDGDVIEGSYAAGNAMGSPFGATYGGAGGTLGPAMVFGYLAGKHAAGRATERAER